MAAFRLAAPLGPDAITRRAIRFRHDGRWVEGRDGEPVAVALLAAGRPVLSRSFRFHRPRGLMCATGQCGWCECRVDGRPGTRTCTVGAREGMEVRSEHSWPNASRDVFGFLDLGSRWIPNTFYHHRFLRPRHLRKLYLEVLRRFGGRGRLTPGGIAGIDARVTSTRAVDVAVVGGGPAGMLAALGAAEAGASVVLVEAGDALGGGWRWRTDDLPSGGSSALAAAIRDRGVEVLLETTAVGIYDGTLTAIGARTHWEIAPRAVVSATGSHERVPRVPDNDRPGVMAARTVEWLIDAYGVVPGRRAVVTAGGPDGSRVAALLRRAGAHVAAEGVELVGVMGASGVASALVRTPGGLRRIGCDLVVFDGRSPNLDLLLGSGAEISEGPAGDLVPVLDADGWSTVPALAAAGACAGRPIVDDASATAARRTGAMAAAGEPSRARSLTAGASVTSAAAASAWPDTTPADVDGRSFVCFCEDVRARELADEVRTTPGDPEILKRRSAALTGPCQGKYCLDAFVGAVNRVPARAGWRVPTARPPLRPVKLADLAGEPLGDRE